MTVAYLGHDYLSPFGEVPLDPLRLTQHTLRAAQRRAPSALPRVRKEARKCRDSLEVIKFQRGNAQAAHTVH